MVVLILSFEDKMFLYWWDRRYDCVGQFVVYARHALRLMNGAAGRWARRDRVTTMIYPNSSTERSETIRMWLGRVIELDLGPLTFPTWEQIVYATGF